MKIILGSRGSQLALKQTELVIESLQEAYPEHEYEIKVIHTKGDKILDRPLEKIGDKGLFVKEIEEQLLNGDIDIAVHSMKDMPSVVPEGLVFTKTLKNADCRDCLVLNGYNSLNEVPLGATIGTGSKRRIMQLKKLRPDLNIVDIRGNINTRIQKMKDQNLAGIVLACAGLKRIGRNDLISEYFNPTEFLPACAQGMLGIEVRENSKLLKMINDIASDDATYKMKLERTFLEEINGSCHIPMGGYYEKDSNTFYAMLGNENELFYETKVLTENPFDDIKNIATILKGKANHE